MTAADHLAVLNVEQRNELEFFLVDFDSEWSPKLLEEYANRVSQFEDPAVQKAAMIELVKIDIQCHWLKGVPKRVESYLKKFPILGSAESISASLIVAEYDARAITESSPSLATYQARFPNQFEELQSLINDSRQSSTASSAFSKSSPQASIETSRIVDTDNTKKPAAHSNGKLGKNFGRYKIIKELGSGAMGTVYLAHDQQLDRQVAIKTPSFVGEDNASLIERFYREARAAAKLQHRNLCPVFDVGEIEGQHYISMAYIQGRCMSDFINAKKLPSQKATALLLHRLAVSLAEAHRHHVVHRDLKPANIMIDNHREPVVMDFGLARQLDVESRMTQSGMSLGTPAYMSPEQVKGAIDEMGPSVDIYSLGVILYQLLTGSLPFQGSIAQVVYAIVNDDPVKPSKLREKLAPDLEAICLKMMAKNTNDRYASMDEVAGDLKRFLQGKKNVSLSKQTSLNAHHQELQTDHEEESQQAIESGAGLASMFEQDASSSGTAIENLRATPSSTTDSAKSAASQLDPTHASLKITNKFKVRRWLIGAVCFFFAMAIAFSILFFARTPHGIVRIEVSEELQDLQVLVDGDTISLREPNKEKATEHRLQLKLGNSLLELDPKTNQFVVSDGRDGPRLSVFVGDTQLSDSKFSVAREGVTLLKIELVDASEMSVSNTDQAAAEADNDTSGASNQNGTESSPNTSSEINQPVPPATPLVLSNLNQPLVLQGHSKVIVGMEFGNDGKHLVSFGADNLVRVWDLEVGEQVRTINWSTAARDLATSPTDPWVAVCGTYGRVELLNWETGATLHVLSRGNGLYMGIDFSPDGNFIVAVNLNNVGKLWDARTGEMLAQFPIKSTPNSDCNVHFLPGGEEFVVLPSGHVAYLYRRSDCSPIGNFRSTHSAGHGTLSADGKRLIRSGFDGSITACDLEKKEVVITLPIANGANSVFSSPDGKWLAVVHKRNVQLLDANTYAVKRKINANPAMSWPAAFSPDSRFLATTYEQDRDGNCQIKVWRIAQVE